jgi:hypothetical protein
MPTHKPKHALVTKMPPPTNKKKIEKGIKDLGLRLILLYTHFFWFMILGAFRN